MIDLMSDYHIGFYEKAGVRREAKSQSAAVALVFEGFRPALPPVVTDELEVNDLDSFDPEPVKPKSPKPTAPKERIKP